MQTPTAPLAGVRVLDAATLAAAPMVATALGEFGAEVIKVEQPSGGDPLRSWGPQKNGVGLMWKSIARNKKSVTLDLRTAKGQEILRRLAETVDVLIMNTRPSTLKRWGLTYDQVQDRNPGLIMVHITAYGAGGPASDEPGFGTMGEAMSGFADLTGQPGGPPTLPPFMLADGVASLSATAAVLAALYQRDLRDGTGQLIDVNLVEPLARLLEHPILAYDQLGVRYERAGSRWDVSVPRNVYQTRDSRWVAMSASSPSIALRVYEAIGRADLMDKPEYRDPQQRIGHADEIDALVASWIKEHDLTAVLAAFKQHQVAVAAIYSAPDLLADPHLKARSAFVRVDDPDLGSMTVQGPVARLSKTPSQVSHLGPALGAHTTEVLSEQLGLHTQEIDDLVREGII